MYKAIIFDFFDVIHDDPLHAWMRLHGLKREGEVAAASRALDKGDIAAKEFFRRLGVVTDQSIDEVEAEFKTGAQLDPAMVRFVDSLSPRYKVCLVSNADSARLRNLLREHQLAPLFDHIVVSSEVGYAKPDPEIFQHALQLLDTDPKETIFIDDNPTNVDSAEKLGIVGITFRGLDALRDELRQLRVID